MKEKISISDLEQQHERAPIWAVNGSASSEVGAPGEIHVGIPKPGGGTKVDDLYLPQSWLPVCLTDFIPRRQLLDASEFRNAVNSGLVILISEEYAKVLKSQEGADEEAARLKERSRQIKDSTAARGIQQNSAADVMSIDELTNVNSGATVHGEKEEVNPLSAGFTMFVTSLGTKSEIEALNLIRGRGQFTKQEIRHMLTELKHKDKVVAFLKPHA